MLLLASPVMISLFGLWVRLEVSLTKSRVQSAQNKDEIKRLDGQVEALKAAHTTQAVQLGRIEEAITNIGRLIEGLALKMEK